MFGASTITTDPALSSLTGPKGVFNNSADYVNIEGFARCCYRDQLSPGLVVTGADNQKYNGGCPSTPLGSWPNVTTPSGVSVVFKPYGTNYTCHGSQATAQYVKI